MTESRTMGVEQDFEEQRSETLLRPGDFSEYIGQKKVVENISLMVESAKIRQQAMDHVLFRGLRDSVRLLWR